MSSSFKFDALGIDRMSSGRLVLSLTTIVTWDEFPECANRLMSAIEGCVKRKSETVDIRIWNFEVNEVALNLVCEDFPQLISIESDSDAGDKEILVIKEKIIKGCFGF